jgi:hypothetical protein
MARRKPDGAGFLTKRIKAKLNAPPDGPWMPIGREMLRSGAMRALSPPRACALDRIMVEHMDHAGQENGRLKVTWQDFEKFGVHRSLIKQALVELTAVGLIAIEQPGRRPHGPDRGDPTQYRLTHLSVCEPANFRPPTNEWKRFEEDIAAAKALSRRHYPSN